MPSQKLQAYLQQNEVKYTSIAHPLAYSAQHISHMCNVPEHQFAKAVIIKVKDKPAMVVMPANYELDFDKLKKSLHEATISLASETDFNRLFTDCELGAMPPFGNLYDIDVYVDKSLANNKEIVFNAGTHTEAIKIAYQDFVKLVKPKEAVAH
ncbi:YbaK/EbsC family protein [Candidatus Berkiella aquae]|uniref:Prolyl-tRNA synthetase n=1 Tax=Candidatus Berkiella aquae TaxID=295108 RepID=A0A0Q9YST2_9GAMM|nr:YbaK/EbsC family protein [Candidatus Berkiella aquae]MCS5712201.1 YbaK/EbsC family protein [Candidatus Berkiella aquae]